MQPPPPPPPSQLSMWLRLCSHHGTGLDWSLSRAFTQSNPSGHDPELTEFSQWARWVPPNSALGSALVPIIGRVWIDHLAEHLDSPTHRAMIQSWRSSPNELDARPGSWHKPSYNHWQVVCSWHIILFFGFLEIIPLKLHISNFFILNAYVSIHLFIFCMPFKLLVFLRYFKLTKQVFFLSFLKENWGMNR